MKKLMVVIVAALMVACVSVHPGKKGSQVDPNAKGKTPAAKTQDDPQQPAPTTPKVQDPKSYLVRLNLVLFPDEIAANPVMKKGLEDALTEWMNEVPIELCPMMDNKDANTPYGMPSIADEPGIVRIHLANVNAAPYFMPEGVLGFWDASHNLLVLDTGYLEKDPDMAYSVALHELGHVLGLPHIENRNSPEALSGEIIVPDSTDASRMVMYPYYDPTKDKRPHLTKLEIEIVREHLLDLNHLLDTSCIGVTLH